MHWAKHAVHTSLNLVLGSELSKRTNGLVAVCNFASHPPFAVFDLRGDIHLYALPASLGHVHCVPNPLYCAGSNRATPARTTSIAAPLSLNILPTAAARPVSPPSSPEERGFEPQPPAPEEHAEEMKAELICKQLENHLKSTNPLTPPHQQTHTPAPKSREKIHQQVTESVLVQNHEVKGKPKRM